LTTIRQLTDEPQDEIFFSGHFRGGIAMSEGSFWPTSWREAIPLTVWGVLIFAFGFEGVEFLIPAVVHFIRGEPWTTELLEASVGIVGMVSLTAMLIHGGRIREKFTDIRWFVAACMFAVAIVTLSPFVEQRRWPFQRAVSAPTQSVGSFSYDAKRRMSLDCAFRLFWTFSHPGPPGSVQRTVIVIVGVADNEPTVDGLRLAIGYASETSLNFKNIWVVDQKEYGRMRDSPKLDISDNAGITIIGKNEIGEFLTTSLIESGWLVHEAPASAAIKSQSDQLLEFFHGFRSPAFPT
jgi:hypothetical protein